MSKESTLTSPEDRDKNNRFRLDTGVPPLIDEQTASAMKVLNITNPFPVAERTFADPDIPLQRIGLISFIPARGATPNENGIFGFAKLRGNYENEDEASARAELLVRNHDSYHQIYHTYVGRPFPLTTSSDFSKEIHKVDFKKEMASAISDDVKTKREKEQKEIEEIQQREKELLADVKKVEEPSLDRYTTLHVKKAQLVWTYNETKKKMAQMCTNIARSIREIQELDEKEPELKHQYYEKYMEARKASGLKTDEESFIKYLVEDIRIPEVEQEYNRLYNEDEKV
jgi:hypothetical protein